MVETLVGLATVSILMLILALCTAPVTRTMHEILLRRHGTGDSCLLLAKTLKTDLFFMLRGKEASRFRADEKGFSFLTMHRAEADSGYSECVLAEYRTGKDGLVKTMNKESAQILKSPVRFYYLDRNNEWQESWPETEKDLPRAIQSLWRDTEGNTTELITALP